MSATTIRTASSCSSLSGSTSPTVDYGVPQDSDSQMEPLPLSMSSDCFVDHPMVTLTLDQPTNLTCVVCMESKLDIFSTANTTLSFSSSPTPPSPTLAPVAAPASPPSRPAPRPSRSRSRSRSRSPSISPPGQPGGRNLPDTVPVIFPCGHIAGHACAAEWLAQNSSCPVCRFDLRYRGCHAYHDRRAADPAPPQREESKGRAMPRVLDATTVHTMPPTIPEAAAQGIIIPPPPPPPPPPTSGSTSTNTGFGFGGGARRGDGGDNNGASSGGGGLTDKCFECSMAELGEAAVRGFKIITRQLAMAREQYALTQDERFLLEAEALAEMQRVHVKETFYAPRETWKLFHW
ncbi:uncharacterized protein MKZ38_003233 [Zalerion maritima]|uniref:RING-type domain-containing protein n=1 Tax=Zalerion maritima TaxID=339359 RepID=A0AAD5S065_9PEZI|nr:uncharacterized protein MKZ38_003233 [Zalerion maritima]